MNMLKSRLPRTLRGAFVVATAWTWLLATAGDGAEGEMPAHEAVMARAESEALSAMREEIRLREELTAGFVAGMAPAEKAKLRREIRRQEGRRKEAQRVTAATRELLDTPPLTDSHESSSIPPSAATFLESFGLSPAAVERTLVALRPYAPYLVAVMAALLLRVLAAGRVRRWLQGSERHFDPNSQRASLAALNALRLRVERVILRLATVGGVTLFLLGALSYGELIGQTFWLVTIAGVSIGVYGLREPLRDTVNGVCLLRDGSYSVGDVINVGPCSGVVEKVSLRTTTLRDAEGNLHFIPHRQVALVTRRPPNAELRAHPGQPAMNRPTAKPARQID